MSNHGYVTPGPAKARCGGPALCVGCREEWYLKYGTEWRPGADAHGYTTIRLQDPVMACEPGHRLVIEFTGERTSVGHLPVPMELWRVVASDDEPKVGLIVAPDDWTIEKVNQFIDEFNGALGSDKNSGVRLLPVSELLLETKEET